MNYSCIIIPTILKSFRETFEYSLNLRQASDRGYITTSTFTRVISVATVIAVHVT